MELKEETKVEEKSPVVLNFAPVWKRIGAYIIDFLLLFFLVSFLSYIAYYKDLLLMQQQSDFEKLLTDLIVRNSFYLNIVTMVVYISYFSLLWSANGQTIGAKIFKIYVIHIENRRLPFGLSFFRALLLWLSMNTFFLILIFVVNHVYKQRIHDFLSNSVVVERPKIKN